MRKSLILLILGLFLASHYGSAQITEPISVESNLWGQKFIQGEAKYKLSELIELFEVYTPAHDMIRSANNQHDFAVFCQISGSFLVLYPFFNDAINRDPNYNMSLIGLGLWAISVPIELRSRQKALDAVLSYNNFQKSKVKASLNIGNGGLGISLRF